MMSSTTRSTALASSSRRARAALSAVLTRKPCLARYLASRSRISRWSSTTRMWARDSIDWPFVWSAPNMMQPSICARGKFVTNCVGHGTLPRFLTFLARSDKLLPASVGQTAALAARRGAVPAQATSARRRLQAGTTMGRPRRGERRGFRVLCGARGCRARLPRDGLLRLDEYPRIARGPCARNRDDVRRPARSRPCVAAAHDGRARGVTRCA